MGGTDDWADAVRYAIGAIQRGCDIHWYSETKKDGAWVCDQAASLTHDEEDDYPDMDTFPQRNQDYWFFGLLCDGVRTVWPWSFKEKGFPEDASPEIKALNVYWDCDGHSHSWLTRAELKAKLEELAPRRTTALIAPARSTEEEGLAHHVRRLEETIRDLSADVPDTDQRIVFWFDN